MEAGQNQPGGSGWNDPPNLSFKIHSETKKRKNLLNKRVCYFDKTQVENRQINLLDPNLSPPSWGLPTSSGPPLTSTGLPPTSTGLPIVEDLPKEDEITSLHSDWINGFRDLANKCDVSFFISFLKNLYFILNKYLNIPFFHSSFHFFYQCFDDYYYIIWVVIILSFFYYLIIRKKYFLWI